MSSANEQSSLLGTQLPAPAITSPSSATPAAAAAGRRPPTSPNSPVNSPKISGKAVPINGSFPRTGSSTPHLGGMAGSTPGGGGWSLVKKNLSSLQKNGPSSAASTPFLGPGAPPPSPASPGSPESPVTPGFFSPKVDKEDRDDIAAMFMNRAGSVSMAAEFAASTSFAADRRASTLSASGRGGASGVYGAAAVTSSGGGAGGGGDGAGTEGAASSAGDEEAPIEPPKKPAPPYRWAKFVFLCLVMSLSVGASGEGVNAFMPTLLSRGLYGDKCAAHQPDCKKANLQASTIVLIALAIMNVAGVFSGIVVDAVGVRIAAVVSAVIWAISTGWSGIDPNDGTAWAAGLVVQQGANGAIFLAIFTGLLQQLFCDNERLFAIASSICSGCWDAGGAAGYMFDAVLKQPSLTLAENYLILAGVFGLVPAVIFQLAFEQPDKKMTMDGLRSQLRAMGLICKKPFFWLLTLNMSCVCAAGYSVLAYAPVLLEWRGATSKEAETMRPWVGNAIAISCIGAVVPGALMSSPRLGLFGGVAATCIILAVLAAGATSFLLFAPLWGMWGTFFCMAFYRTGLFTMMNCVTPIWLIALDEIHEGQSDVKYASATGLCFGVASLIGGAVSLAASFIFNTIFQGPSKPLVANATSTLAPSSSAASLSSFGAVLPNATTTTTDAPQHIDSIAPDWVFATSMAIVWGITTVAPVPLAIRCWQLQAERDLAHHQKHKKHHHHHHHHHHDDDDGDKKEAEQTAEDAADAAHVN